MPNLESFIVNKVMITDDNVRDLLISNKTKTIRNFSDKLSNIYIKNIYFFSMFGVIKCSLINQYSFGNNFETFTSFKSPRIRREKHLI